MSDKRVLIIDDDQTFANVMRDGLESVGFKAAVAFDALQGVMQAHQTHPDVILLDVNMPAGGGANAYERLRASTGTGRIPVVFTTAAPVEEVKSQIRAGPKTYFLKKPVSLNQVRAVLLQVLGMPPDGGGATPVPTPSAAPAAAESAAPAPTSSPQPVRETASRITLPPLPSPSPVATAAPAAAAEAPTAAPPLPEPPPLASDSPMSRSAEAPQIQISSPAVKPPPSLEPPPAMERPAPTAPPASRKGHAFEVRVLYADTDKMGVIYYANYLKFFEQGRVELMRSIGIRYRDLEAERKLFLPVIEARCAYKAPARYDELLIVRTRLSRLGQASVCFSYEIVSRDAGERLVAEGMTRHAIVGEAWRPIAVPEDLRARLAPYVSHD